MENTDEGVTIRAAAGKTGYTQWQLRHRIREGTIRYKKCGKRVKLHPEDVAALAKNTWQGAAIEEGKR